MLKLILIVIATVILTGSVIALGWYQWSDCLEENSFFTCSRMLNK